MGGMPACASHPGAGASSDRQRACHGRNFKQRQKTRDRARK